MTPDIFKQSKLLSTTGKPYKRLAGKTVKFPAAFSPAQLGLNKRL
jgi:hypothetical protein